MSSRMPLIPTLQTFIALRKASDVVVTTMSAAREWPKLAQHPLDFHYIPSTMGGGMPLGLGLALAQPQREVIVFTGDGSLLMNLGSLVTIVDSGAANITVAVVDNGAYEVTGGQRTAASDAATDFAGIARAVGFPNVAQFSDADDLAQRLSGVLAAHGPRFIWLQIEPSHDNFHLDPPGPLGERLAAFRAALAH